jgi:lipopolysaccharide transport system ATP-binding protein
MNDDLLIKVDNVSKKFCRDLKTSLKYGVIDLTSEMLRIKRNVELRKKEFWAVDDVSFELKRGDCLGLVGRNGAGKSTLLKMLNGLIKPDNGRIVLRGRITALIELGAGFNPILTGRENIYNNAAVLGFKKKEIDSLLDEIIEFSEIEDFIDTPVQYYSSGMKVRLGFSVAVHLKPDILLLDEVLAVGDAGFKMKSLNKMYEIINNAAVIFVNHSMATISRVCNKVMYLKNGKVIYYGYNMMEGIEKYLSQYDEGSGIIEFNEEAQIQNIRLSSSIERGYYNSNIPIIHYHDDLVVDIEYNVGKNIDKHNIRIQIANKDFLFTCAHASSELNNSPDGHNKVRLVIPKIELINGEYSITIYIRSGAGKRRDKYLATYRNWLKFKVVGLDETENVPFFLSGKTTKLL